MARGRNRLSLAALLALATLPLGGCGSSATPSLQVVQSTDLPQGQDHRGHVAPGAFAGITISISNTGSGPARGVQVRDALPPGFHFYEVTALGGDAIRTATSDPATQGDPQWGTWTLPGQAAGHVTTLVISFSVQVASQPGAYTNSVEVSGLTPLDAQPIDPAVLVVDPRPSLTLAVAATSAQTIAGGIVTYVASVTNVGSAPASGVAVSVSLPPGFLYQSTNGYDGNGTRTIDIDPPANSLLPVWASWSLPAMSGNVVGLLRVTFQVRILPGVVAGLYSLTGGLTANAPVASQTVGALAPVAVGKATTVPVSMTVAAASPYVPQGGAVTYVITVENDSVTAASGVVVTDTLPAGFTFDALTSISINGKGAGSRLQPAPGSATPQWGPFSVPGGGFNGSILTITFTAKVAATTALGPHPNVVSGNASNAQITGGSDAIPVTVTAS
jgi:uncharacterized repeat protein (TIGR01451 family)